MAKPEYFVFVCAQQRPAGHPRGSCGNRGAGQVLEKLSQGIMSKNLMQKVSIVQTACVGPCSVGANMLVFPDNVMYSGLTPRDVDQIVDQHLIGGNPVTEKIAPDAVW